MPGGLLGSPMSVEMIDPYAYDADARRYIRAVEAADGQVLEVGVRVAINAFVVGCKADGFWDLISDCCILCGARTLAGSLVPLKGVAPTNFNFVSGDYLRGGRTPGLRGDGTSKYLWTNRKDTFFNTNNVHCSVFITDVGTVSSTGQYFGASNLSLALLYINTLKIAARAFFSASLSAADLRATGLIALSRVHQQAYLARGSRQYERITGASGGAQNLTLAVLARNGNGGEGQIDIRSNGRCAFYSMGAGVDLMLLERRVTNLIAGISAALP